MADFDFKRHVTLTLDRVILHTVMQIFTYTPHFMEIEETLWTYGRTLDPLY